KTWREQCFEAGQFVRSLKAQTSQPDSDDDTLRLRAASAAAKSKYMTGDPDEDSLIEKMAVLAERIAKAIQTKDVATLRKLAGGMVDDEDDETSVDGDVETKLASAQGRLELIQACGGRNEIERASTFLASCPI